MKFICQTFSQQLFENALQKSNDRLLSQSTLSAAFYQQELNEIEMLKQFGVRADQIYQ